MISPIASITKGENTATYGDGTPQPITVELYEALTGIQNQTAEDNFSGFILYQKTSEFRHYESFILVPNFPERIVVEFIS